MTLLFEIKDLTGGYSGTNVVFDVSAKIDRGGILGVFGRNGVGKSTLARLANGGLPPSGGQILLDGDRIEELPAFMRRELGIGFMPQESLVFDNLSVRENLYIGTIGESPGLYFDRFPVLARRLDQIAGAMSGGERKILSFVRSMIEDTRLVILDEPSEGVQSENINLMATCLKERAAKGAGIMIFEQNLGFLASVADHFLGLDAGRAVYSEPSSNSSETEIRAILAL
ncbi:MAG: ATP-binding cassette domain-containing protein [Albidovulum sp.]|nr:ATP-binding cassette domain-containing protein [Albidovulum sp.]MDE0530470.1 ATP-binding cassette domain-containing protein [Albidovulum sp.]